MATDVSNYLQSIEDRIDSIDTCELLQEAGDSIKAELSELLQDMQDQITSMTAQTTFPVDLATTIAWITAQINAVVVPMEAYIAELTLIASKVASILSKLENKISTLGCSFSPPSIP